MLLSHSYLGNGLFAARLATLGALGADGRVFCIVLPLFHWHYVPVFYVPMYSLKMANSFLFLYSQVWIGKSSLVLVSRKSLEKK